MNIKMILIQSSNQASKSIIVIKEMVKKVKNPL